MILIIINNLTTNKSENYFNNILRPHLDKNNYTYDVIYTKNDNLHFKKYEEYIIIGGDGTLNYYIKKFNLQEKDASILCIPTGSGNGLSKNLNIDDKNFIRVFENKNIKTVNLQKINYANNNLINDPVYSFLFITWGLISDIDIDTEFLRFLGEYRFYYGIIKFLLLGNTTYGKLYYLDVDNEEYIIEGNFSLFCSSLQKWISKDFNMIPCADENYINIIYINRNISFYERCKLFYELLNESHIINCSFIKYKRVKSYTLEKYDNKSKFVYDGEVLDTKIIEVTQNNSINFYKN
jgi:sphingosine kinase